MKPKAPKRLISDNLAKSYDSKNLKAFPSYSQISKYSKLTFNRNPIKSLMTLPSLENLKTLELNNTEIETFEGAKKQPQLTSISLRFSPISDQRFFIEMCLISLGNQINSINGKTVTKKQHKFVADNEATLLPYINQGWIITSIKPNLHIFELKTRQRKVFYYPKEPIPVFSTPKMTSSNSKSNLSKINNSTSDLNTEITTSSNEQEIDTESTAASQTSFESTITNKSSKNLRCYQLTEPELDTLTDQLISLSQQWNSLAKYSITQNDYEETQFDDPLLLNDNEMEDSPPSLIKTRRLVQHSMKYRPVSETSNVPFMQTNKSYYVQKKEEENRMKEEKRQEMLRRKLEEEEEEIEEEKNQSSRLQKSMLQRLQNIWNAFSRTRAEENEVSKAEEPNQSEIVSPEQEQKDENRSEAEKLEGKPEINESEKNIEDESSAHQTSESEKADVFKRRRISSLTRFILKTNQRKTTSGESSPGESESELAPSRRKRLLSLPPIKPDERRTPITRRQSMKSFEYANKILSESTLSDTFGDDELFKKDDNCKHKSLRSIKRERRRSIPVPPKVNLFKDKMMLKHLRARMLSDMSGDEMDRLADDEIITTKITQKMLDDYDKAAPKYKNEDVAKKNFDSFDDECNPEPRKKYKGRLSSRTFSASAMRPPIPIIPASAYLQKVKIEPPLTQILPYQKPKTCTDDDNSLKLDSSMSEATFTGTPPNASPISTSSPAIRSISISQNLNSESIDNETKIDDELNNEPNAIDDEHSKNADGTMENVQSTNENELIENQENCDDHLVNDISDNQKSLGQNSNVDLPKENENVDLTPAPINANQNKNAKDESGDFSEFNIDDMDISADVDESAESDLRLAAFNEILDKYPDKIDDEEFINEYIKKYKK